MFERLGRAEERSEILTKEAAKFRTNLEQLWNEIAETQKQLKTDFPVEDVFVNDNDSMKSGYSPSLSDASSQTDSIISHQVRQPSSCTLYLLFSLFFNYNKVVDSISYLCLCLGVV